MPNPERPKRYTYLLTLWQEGRTWRAALRSADGGPRQGFGDLEQLVAFLLRLQDDRGGTAPTSLTTTAAAPRQHGPATNTKENP